MASPSKGFVGPKPHYDLTRTMARFFDTHLLFPIMQHVEECEVYDKKDVVKAKIDLVNATNSKFVCQISSKFPCPRSVVYMTIILGPCS